MAQKGKRKTTVSADELSEELRPVLRRGLPVGPDTAGDVLPRLACVAARAIHKRDRMSRVAALDEVLVKIFESFGENDQGRAISTLFGLGPGLRGTTLTLRRSKAAGLLGYEETHFRKRIEPRLLAAVALELDQENRRYSPRRKGSPPNIEPTGQTPSLTTEHLTDLEELTSRIWSHVYGWRAELIAVGRLARESPDSVEYKQHVEGGLWELAQLLALLSEFLDRHGEKIMHGDLEFATEHVVRLAGWHPPFNDAETKRLRYVLARVGTANPEAFSKLLRGSKTGRDLLGKWGEWMVEWTGIGVDPRESE